MKYQNYNLNPESFPLGYHHGWSAVPVAKKSTSYSFWIPTIHNIEWGFSLDTTKSEETNNVKYKVYQKNVSPDSFHSIELDVGVIIENLENSEFSIHAEGNYEFTGEKNEMIIEIPGWDKISDSQMKFFDDKKSEKTFAFQYVFVVKSTRLCDSVRMLDLYTFDPSIFDIEVNVCGHTMFMSKKFISLQSPTLAALVETKKIDYSDLPSDVLFEHVHDFLQIVHGIDLKLDVNNTEHFLELARDLNVPRVTEYCKKQMIIGCRGMSTNDIIELAQEFSFWDLLPRKLDSAHSLADLKAQNWDLEKLDSDVIEMISRRMFELK